MLVIIFLMTTTTNKLTTPVVEATDEQVEFDKMHEEAFDAYFEDRYAADAQKAEDAFSDAYEAHTEDMCCPDY